MATIPRWAREGRAQWRWTGERRPPFAVPPAAGQESVWDYPRPPALGPDGREVVVSVRGHEIARTKRAIRVLETASPPTFYVPPEDVEIGALVAAPGVSRCEWKGEARYWAVSLGSLRVEHAAWSYPDPFPGFEAIRDWIAFYPGRVDCFVDGERAAPQPGGLYGGWVTAELVGPWKGAPGTGSW